jgi:hypothetical protein
VQITPNKNSVVTQTIPKLSAVFQKQVGSGTHSDPKFRRRGRGVLVISMTGEKVQERRSSLRPSAKELPERRSVAFCHKNTPS